MEHILERVEDALGALVRLADKHEGLIPSIIDLDGTQMLQEMPPAIEGQRDGDRSFRGSNTIHDEATLATLYALAIVRGRDDLRAAADRYLQRFATHCTATQTGLFPWGEHAFWDLDADSIGDSHKLRNPSRTGSAIHDHLRATPFWLWENSSSSIHPAFRPLQTVCSITGPRESRPNTFAMQPLRQGNFITGRSFL